MWKRFCAALLAAVLLCPSMTATSEAAGPPGVSAASAILVDGDSGRVLWAHNAHERRLIASITKLMTALVAVETVPDLTTEITIRPEWVGAEGSSMYLRSGEVVTLEGLLYGLLLASGNDAAIAIAGACAGDVETFVSRMNERAAALDMADTHFANPNGLNDEAHYSTAADMAKLARVVMDDPRLAEIVATRSITIAGRSFTNHNKLLWRCEGCIGMKTGYTDKAGRTLVSCTERSGQRLIVVTLNAPDDWKDHMALYDYGFQTWPRKLLATEGKMGWHVAVSGSLVPMVGVCTGGEAWYPLTAQEQVRATVTLPRQVEAPVEQGTVVGELSFFLGEEQIATVPLVFSQDVRDDRSKHMGLWARILRFFQRNDDKMGEK